MHGSMSVLMAFEACELRAEFAGAHLDCYGEGVLSRVLGADARARAAECARGHGR
jgi:hypothetical protein